MASSGTSNGIDRPEDGTESGMNRRGLTHRNASSFQREILADENPKTSRPGVEAPSEFERSMLIEVPMTGAALVRAVVFFGLFDQRRLAERSGVTGTVVGPVRRQPVEDVDVINAARVAANQACRGCERDEHAIGGNGGTHEFKIIWPASQ